MMNGNGVQTMKLLTKGKTKDVYEHEAGHIVLKFKDDLTGEDGVFDPGADTVGLTVEGAGQSGLRVSQFFFDVLQEKNIPTHYISANIADSTMSVKKATMFGAGLEVICRYRAVGSFYRRYGAYCEEGQRLNGLIEVTIKDDERQDPPISKDALIDLNLLTKNQYDEIKELTRTVSNLIKDELAKKDLELYDIKLEFGLDEAGDIMLIDEISGGNMRVYKGEEYIAPLDLEKHLLQT